MGLKAPLSIESIDQSTTRAATHVFQVMANLTITPDTDPASEALPETGLLWMGSVGFLGDMNGIIYLCFPDPLAHRLAERILGMNSAELAEAGHDMVKDVVGEITNTSVGTFKNAFSAVGYPCMLTLPTIIRIEQPQILPIKGATRRHYTFNCDGFKFYIDLQFTTD